MKTKTVCIFFFLFLNALYDLRKREILLFPTILFGIVGCFLPLLEQNTAYPDIFTGMLPGLFLFLVRWISSGSIGCGDAILLLCIGLWTGFWDCLLILIGGLLLASIYSAILLLKKTHHRKDQIPFVPFLMLAYLVRCL